MHSDDKEEDSTSQQDCMPLKVIEMPSGWDGMKVHVAQSMNHLTTAQVEQWWLPSLFSSKTLPACNKLKIRKGHNTIREEICCAIPYRTYSANWQNSTTCNNTKPSGLHETNLSWRHQLDVNKKRGGATTPQAAQWKSCKKTHNQP